MNFILELDQKLFLTLNALRHPLMDGFMLAATDVKFWIPFYLWFIYILFKKLDHQAWYALLGIAITVLISDQVTSHLLKPLVQRLRPSHEPSLESLVNLVATPSGTLYKGGKFGFPSSHAANAFGVAFFLWLVIGKAFRWTILAFPIAAILAYSRIYLGVHYPLDILVGVLIGLMAALLSWKIFKRFNTLPTLKESNGSIPF